MMNAGRKLIHWLGGRGATLTAGAIIVLLGAGLWAGTIRVRANHHLGVARKALAEGRIDEARARLARCLELRPVGAEVHFLAGRAARRAGAGEEARASLRRSRELGWPEEAVTREEVLLATQYDPRPFAGYLMQRVQNEDPERELILEALSRGYMHLFDPPKALHCLNLWLGLNPNAVQALAWRGDARERLGQFDAAHEDYERLVELAPDDAEGRTRLAKLLLRGRKLEEAAAHFEQAHQQRPDDLEVLRGLARCRQDQNRREEAGQLLDRALELHPDDVSALTQRGGLALEVGQLADAEAALTRAVKLAPFEREPLFNLGRCLHAQGNHSEAGRWEERLRQVEADLLLVRKTQAQVLAAPTAPNPRREIGAIFLRNGQEAEGLRWMRSALQCDPDDAPTHRELAAYYEKQGRSELAAQHRRRVP
jgi:tetratricopeptide (TPR) repeat protein